MSCSRRNFLKKTIKGVVAASLPISAFRVLNPTEVRAAIGDDKVRYAFLVDTRACIGCGFCVKSCKIENEVPLEAPITRTWVERYINLKDGRHYIDSPKAGVEGYTDSGVRGEKIRDEDIQKAFFVPKLCNQCENPSCVQVCPVGATFKTLEGVVLVDRKWCIGCGYCIMACPYGVRFFHPVHKVADKCTFCYHRICKDQQTACELACPSGARRLGNLKDPDDPVAKIILSQRVSVLKDEYGTKPQVFYLGLDVSVR